MVPPIEAGQEERLQPPPVLADLGPVTVEAGDGGGEERHRRGGVGRDGGNAEKDQ